VERDEPLGLQPQRLGARRAAQARVAGGSMVRDSPDRRRLVFVNFRQAAAAQRIGAREGEMLEDIDRPRDPVRAPDRMRIELETYSWPLTRVATGLVFVPHGMQKLFDFWGGSLEWTAAEFARAGLEPAIFWSNYIGFLEFFGGILLAIGLLTRPVSVLFVSFLAVAAIRVNILHGWFWTSGGMEIPLFLLLICLAILIRGGGPFSLDRVIGRS
jgi:putative oxidoreductase